MSERWSMPGCLGRFYTRGKGNIIWYKRGRGVNISTGLELTRQNKRIAGDKIRLMENPEFISNDNKPATVYEAFEKFMKSSANVKHRNTLEQYVYSFNAILNKSVPLDIHAIQTVIERALEGSLAKKTLKTYIARMQSFFKYCVKNKWLEENPIDEQYKIKVPKKIIEIYSQDELDEIFDYWKRDDTYFSYLKLLYHCALRRSEGMNLTWEQVLTNNKFRQQIIFPHSKYGDRPDFFPISDSTREIFTQIPSYKEKSGKIFPYNSEDYMSQKMKDGLKILNIPIQTTNHTGYGRNLHTLRKTRISQWLFADNLPPQVVSKLSRDTIQTIMEYYAHVDNDNLVQYIK